MYRGRSIWTRGVLALGIGALLLWGWRLGWSGDESSATASTERIGSSRIDSYRSYFSVAVASSRSPRNRDDNDDDDDDHDDHHDHHDYHDGENGKKEDSRRQDRPVDGDYSTNELDDAWTNRNAEPDMQHGTSYSAEERSLPSLVGDRLAADYHRVTDVSAPRDESSNYDERFANFVDRHGERSRADRDENRFSTDREEIRGAFNGAAVGERSRRIKENSSRRVNGESMNEVADDLGRSHDTTASAIGDEINGELAAASSIGYLLDAVDAQDLSLSGNETDSRFDGKDMVESTERGKRVAESASLDSFDEFVGREERWRKSRNDRLDPAALDPRRFDGMQDTVPFFRDRSARSIASAFEERNRRTRIRGTGTRRMGSSRRSPEAADLPANFREIEEAFVGYGATDPAADGDYASVSETDPAESLFSENVEVAEGTRSVDSSEMQEFENDRHARVNERIFSARFSENVEPFARGQLQNSETSETNEIKEFRNKDHASVKKGGGDFVVLPFSESVELFEGKRGKNVEASERNEIREFRKKDYTSVNERDPSITSFSENMVSFKGGRLMNSGTTEKSGIKQFQDKKQMKVKGEDFPTFMSSKNVDPFKEEGLQNTDTSEKSEVQEFSSKVHANVNEINVSLPLFSEKVVRSKSGTLENSEILETSAVKNIHKDDHTSVSNGNLADIFSEIASVKGERLTNSETKKNSLTPLVLKDVKYADDRIFESSVSSEETSSDWKKSDTKAQSANEKSSLSLLGDVNLPRGKYKTRRRRYTNYYLPQSVTPMAYVHIQPAYPVATPPPVNRKCVRCMVVYKPCPSMPRQPPRVVLPTYKYQEPALKWHGLKYGCRCNSVGSITSACDIVTGQCQCKAHVTGRQCDRCMVGYWGLPAGAGCAPCGCDPTGSYNSSCHDITGQCYCKPGVGGSRCEKCLPGYYGFSSKGCQVCDPCVRPGHICDPDTGRCVCPTLTFGEHCDRCRPGSWDLIPGVGCRHCDCTLGSTKPHCDHQGQCPCRIGYDGRRCEKCAKGYYGYPRCRPCSCNLAGTLQCGDKVCDCDEQGQCPCKEHVYGRQCNQCKEGTFGLAVDSPKGCTECFCFGRTTSCQQAGLSWGQRRLTRPRTLYINDTINDIVISKFRSQIFLSPVNGGLNMTNGLATIPDVEGDVTIPSNLYFSYPLYWMLPEQFLGDKVVSYGGFLRFTTLTEDGIPLKSNLQYPLVQLQGNHKIVLEYYLPIPVNNNHYEVRFHESLWQLQNRPDYKVTREVLMVALQNLQYVLVKASDNAEFTKTALLEASLDAAVLTPTHTPPFATGVEICKCPPEYNSTSCQDPSIGYYRWHKNTTVTSTIVIDLVGEARRCQCNGRSEICDKETGHCLNCRGNTVGPSCNVCADSFYGHPDFGCKPCPCPQTDKRFSNTCMVFANVEPICVCKPGYIGRRCERCSLGYYGHPHLPDGKCMPCNCNPAGSLSDECDMETGQCRCRVGSTGRDCSECTAYRHVYINNVCTSCNDNCTGILLDTVAILSQELAEGTTHIADGYIPPPWEELSYIDSNTTRFFEEMDLRNKLKQRMRNIPWHEYRQLKKHVETLLRRANEQTKQADALKSESVDLRSNIFSAKIEIDNLRSYINDTILLLSHYNNDNKRIEIKKALKTAKMILNNLKNVNLTKKTMEIEMFLKDVAEYTKWLNSLYDPTEPLTIAQGDADKYSVKLNDMKNIIEGSMETLFTYDGLYNNINQTLLAAKDHCNEINMLRNEVNESINEAEKLTDETHGFIVDIQNDIQDLPELQSKLTYWFDKLNMKEELLYRLNYEYNDKYVVPAVEHSKNLSNYVDEYVSLFSETRNIAASPLKASQAYKNIVDSIITANITAVAVKGISEDTYNKVFPDGPKSKSLLDKANETSLTSTKQWDSARKHGKIVQNINDELEFQREAVNTLKDTLNNTGIRDNQINVKLQLLQNDSEKLREKVQNILDDNEEVLEAMKDNQKLIDDYKEGIANRLKPKLYELKREGDSKISLASEKLSEALSNIKKADAKLISLSNAAVKRRNVFDKWNDTLAKKLQNLKDKIAEARNTADGIRVSLRSAEGKECIRSYRPSTLQPSSTNTIVMTFALLKGKKEGSLFYLPSSINDDFIALEIINRRVRFLWNVGGGTGVVVHPEIIESGDLQDDKVWYRVEAERVRHLGKLYVRKQAWISGGYPPVTNSTDFEYGRFDITMSDRVWIGGIPKSQRRRTELTASNGLPACVHQVILDGKPIGLWNFITTAPDMACRACVEGVEDARDEVAYSFNGEGYAVRNRVSSGPYNKYTFGVSINFRTYDENALLFLAINPNNNQHIMIFLREGKVILHIGYGSNVSMKMSSYAKYNTGNWTKVDAFRQYQLRKNIEKCSLSVGGEADKRIGVPTPQPKKEDIPDFVQAKYYIGGVPPSFRAEKLGLPSQVSFLGCMSNINVQEGYDPMAEQYYGVEPSCGNKPLKIVGFYGDGYLEHLAYTLRKINSTVSFSFRTMQKEAVLLLSTFEGLEERINNIRHGNDETYRESYYSVCVINGQIQVRLNAGRGELILQSNDTFNDGRYHTVTIIKKRKDVELRVDDAYQIAGRLPTGAAIKAPEEGGLFFGGLPLLINNTKMIATTTPLYGAIKDAIFNEEIIRFDEVVSFDHALIGRSGPSMGKDPPAYTPSASLSRGLSTQPEGCQKVPYYSLEPGALKFGDKPNSHTQLYLNFKKFWEKKYAIEFDFRTYYPNGLLFITPGLRPKHYLMVVMRDGQLLLLVKSKQRKEILFKTPFNDGNWHRVVISHDERKLTLLVDAQTPRTIKVPRKIGLASMMYIGGLPESGTPIPEQVVVKLETLKGCIRGLRVNGNVYDMVGSTSRAYQVGQCFPNVESGAYFQDEAYAIYKRNFELGAVLELQLEFRTSELSGVLLSITAPGDSPSLSLELNNGKVIMSGDLGDNNPLYVEQHFPSPYTICDNRWHRIQAVYNDEELALKVDEMDQKYGLPANVNYHIMDSTVSGPLYIGGLPASAPKGTLITRDHFNGCIRNVMIGGERRDWTDMDELHNIHLSSCPVQ